MMTGLTDMPETELFSDAQNPALSEPEAALFNERLLALLAAQMRRKTQGDSTSLRVEEAAELLASIRFTLSFHIRQNALPVHALLTEEPAAFFAQAQQTVLEALAQAKRLYAFACQTVRPLGSRSLRDTLGGIGRFFARYDARLYAHAIPADIDYQLCHPVPETELGVAYIIQYLQRLLWENELISRLEETRVLALLGRIHPDYGELLVNLYEPTAANVIGLSLLGGGETLLELTPAQGERIYAMLAAQIPDDALTMLTHAALRAYQRLSLHGQGSAQYLAKTAEALYPRLMASPSAAKGVFAVCKAP